MPGRPCQAKTWCQWTFEKEREHNAHSPALPCYENRQNLAAQFAPHPAHAGQPDAQEHHAGAGIWNRAKNLE